MPRRKPRESYDRATTLLPEVPTLGTDAPRFASDRGLRPHAHPGAFELCYISRGRVEWWVGAEVYEVGPGEVYVTRPGETHGGVDAVLHPCELYWLTVRLGGRRPLPGTAREDAARVASRFHALEWRCFAGSRAVQDCFERLLAEHRAPDALSRAAARAALHELLVTVLRDHDAHHQRQRSREAHISEPMREATRWMSEHLDADFGVEEAATRAGLSVSRFHERFRREVGFTPAEWRTHRRVGYAKQLLRDPSRSITDVALATGFSTSQYFATTFKRLVGITPREYRKRVRGG